MRPCELYLIYGGNERQLLYVGIGFSALRRLIAHSSATQWWQSATEILLERCATRDEALKRERAYIKELRPVFNKAHNQKPAKSKYVLLKLPRHILALLDDEASRERRSRTQQVIRIFQERYGLVEAAEGQRGHAA